MAHWLITGGAGFIGSHLAAALVAAGDRVTVLDDLSSGRRANLAGLERLRLVEGALSDRAALNDLAQGVDGVFHLAARVSVPDCITHWRQGHEDNLIGSLNVFDAACLAQSGDLVPVVYMSSAAVYGDCGEGLCHEDMAPRPHSPYGADKLACEHQARAFAVAHGLPSFGLRLFNVYGPRQNAQSPYSGVIARFAANLRAGRAHEIHGDGQQARDFLFVADAVEGMRRAMATLKAAPRDAQGQARAEICNLCTGRATTLLELTEALDRAHGPAARPVLRHGPARGGDIRFSCGDPTRMTALLGPMRPAPLDAGLGALLRED